MYNGNAGLVLVSKDFKGPITRPYRPKGNGSGNGSGKGDQKEVLDIARVTKVTRVAMTKNGTARFTNELVGYMPDDPHVGGTDYLWPIYKTTKVK